MFKDGLLCIIRAGRGISARTWKKRRQNVLVNDNWKNKDFLNCFFHFKRIDTFLNVLPCKTYSKGIEDNKISTKLIYLSQRFYDVG